MYKGRFTKDEVARVLNPALEVGAEFVCMSLVPLKDTPRSRSAGRAHIPIRGEFEILAEDARTHSPWYKVRLSDEDSLRASDSADVVEGWAMGVVLVRAVLWQKVCEGAVAL